LLEGGKLAEAAEAAKRCEDPRCALVLARAMFGLGHFDAAAAALDPVRGKLGDLAAHTAVLQGESFLRAGRAKDAVEPLRAAVALDPKGPPGLRAEALLADALLALGDAGAALEQARRAAAAVPAELRAAMAWDEAQALLIQGPPREAALALRAFWLQHPEHPAAEDARKKELELQVELPPLTGHELLLRASRFLAAGMPAQATAQAKAAAAMLTGEARAEAMLLHARALAADGKRSEAGPSLEEAAAHGAPHVAAQAGMLLARDRARRGRDAEARAIAERIARQFPDSPEAEESALFVARLLLDAGKRPQARATLAKLAARRKGPNADVAR